MGVSRKTPSAIKSKKINRRGNGKRNKNGFNSEQIFSLWGNNSNGLKAKISSLRANIEYFETPSCITIQETKLRQNNIIKLKGYKVFEKQRKGLGGGILTAVLDELNPVLISDGDENEILVVQAKVGNQNVRVFNCYGPQEDENFQTKVDFWNTLEKEIISATDNNCFNPNGR